jgi:vacuolar-type H+-ATPase subunit E/Vma4
VGRIKSDQKCAELEANQAKSSIVAKLENAERNAQLAAQTEASFYFRIIKEFYK